MRFGVISLILLSVKLTASADPYLDGIKRSKLFELTDFVVPKFHITISDEDFITLKQSVNKNSNETIGNIEDNDPCAAVKATRNLLETLGIDIEQMGGQGNSGSTPAPSNPGASEADTSAAAAGAEVIKMLKESNVDEETINGFIKFMKEGKIEPKGTLAFMKMMKNGSIDPSSAAVYMQNMNLDPEVSALFMKIMENANTKPEENEPEKKEENQPVDQAAAIIEILKANNVDDETSATFLKLMQEGKIDPNGAATFMKMMQSGSIDPQATVAYMQNMNIDPEVAALFMKMMQSSGKSTNQKRQDSAEALFQMLKSINVDDETIATFKKLMQEGKIDPNGTAAFIKMMQSGSIDPSSAASYMQNMNPDPEVATVFMKIMESANNKPEEKEPEKKEQPSEQNDQIAAIMEMLKANNVDDETAATFLKFMQEGKIDPNGAATFMKMMQSGSIDPQATVAYMQNMNIDPEVAALFMKIMQSGNTSQDIKPKEYTEKPSIFEVNAKLIFTLDDEYFKFFDKVKFGISGASSLFNYKPSFKINIKDKKDLYGVKNLKLKSDVTDGSMLTTKIVSDLRLKNGMLTTQSNFAELYINDQYMGLYVLTESFKKQWVKDKFGVNEVKNLYKCNDNGKLTYYDSFNGCKNEDEKADKTEWATFLKTLDAATSEKDIESIFDVEDYLKNAAFDYLNGSLDHYTAGAFHNFYMVKASGDAKWRYIPYDFDNDLYAFGYDKNNLICQTAVDYTNFFDKNAKLNQLLIFSNIERFTKLIQEIADKFWNPLTIYPRIDILKKFLTPYMKKDRTIGESGHVAGAINLHANYISHENSFEEWSNFVEFSSSTAFGCGLKRWIAEKYRYICENNIQCDVENQEYVKSLKYDTTFVVSPTNEKGSGNPGSPSGSAIGDSQTNVSMEEQYNIFKVCDSVDLFYVMANYYRWDFSKMVIDPETGLAIVETKEEPIKTETPEKTLRKRRVKTVAKFKRLYV